MWKDLKAPTVANILALNAFAHHDIITLPLGMNQTITTETLDVVEDATSRIPKIGGFLNNIIGGFHSLIFGKSPSGFKQGGQDNRLQYYGNSMIGLMSREMNLFYTAQYYNSLNLQHKGIIPFNAFQDQGDEPLSTLLSAKSNSTVLNFKITDLIEASVYNKKHQKPKVKRVEVVSTVHIAQEPLKEWEDEEEMKTLSTYQWQEGDVILVDKNFNTLVDPRDKKVIARFGKNSDSRRQYVINEACIQAIGAADIVLTFFAEDPIVYGYEQVTIWEGKFRNNAKVTKSTRGWTTTIRFDQPKIVDEEGEEYPDYNYPRTIQHDIQRRPNLPPPPYEIPGEIEAEQLWTYSFTVEEEKKKKKLNATGFFKQNLEKDSCWTGKYLKYKEKYNVEIPLVYALQSVLVNYLDYNQDKEEYTLFASSDSLISESKYNGLRHYKARTASDLIDRAKTLKANKWWHKDEGKKYRVVHNWGEKYVWEGIYTNTAYTRKEVATSKPNWDKLPPVSTPWIYWHAYYLAKKELLEKGPITTSKVESLWYNGMYKDTER